MENCVVYLSTLILELYFLLVLWLCYFSGIQVQRDGDWDRGILRLLLPLFDQAGGFFQLVLPLRFGLSLGKSFEVFSISLRCILVLNSLMESFVFLNWYQTVIKENLVVAVPYDLMYLTYIQDFQILLVRLLDMEMKLLATIFFC